MSVLNDFSLTTNSYHYRNKWIRWHHCKGSDPVICHLCSCLRLCSLWALQLWLFSLASCSVGSVCWLFLAELVVCLVPCWGCLPWGWLFVHLLNKFTKFTVNVGGRVGQCSPRWELLIRSLCSLSWYRYTVPWLQPRWLQFSYTLPVGECWYYWVTTCCFSGGCNSSYLVWLGVGYWLGGVSASWCSPVGGKRRRRLAYLLYAWSFPSSLS